MYTDYRLYIYVCHLSLPDVLSFIYVVSSILKVDVEGGKRLNS